MRAVGVILCHSRHSLRAGETESNCIQPWCTGSFRAKRESVCVQERLAKNKAYLCARLSSGKEGAHTVTIEQGR